MEGASEGMGAAQNNFKNHAKIPVKEFNFSKFTHCLKTAITQNIH